WLMREVTAPSDACIGLLPAWSARSQLYLTDPSLGFATAKNAIAAGRGPWQAGQSAVTRYSRTGFEAAAVTAVAVAIAARLPGKRREAELRFGHPYAAVAITTDTGGAGHGTAGRGRAGHGSANHGPWHGLPVFSAWVSEPEDATGGNAARSTQH